MLPSGTRAWITFGGPIPKREKEKGYEHSASNLNTHLQTGRGIRTVTEKPLVRETKNKKQGAKEHDKMKRAKLTLVITK